jgi:hypothetical protein
VFWEADWNPQVLLEIQHRTGVVVVLDLRACECMTRVLFALGVVHCELVFVG